MEVDRPECASWSPTVDVYIVINYTKILDIDTLNQRFHAEAIIESKWFDPGIKTLNDTIDEKHIWKPDLYVENGLIGKEYKEEIIYRIISENIEIFVNQNESVKETRFMICEIRKVIGIFHENLELENFPLDVQDLTIHVATKKPGNIVKLITMQEEKKILKVSNTLDKSMWKMHHFLLTTKYLIIREYSFGVREYPSIKVSAKVFRQPGFFYWNAILPILLVTLASLTPFVIDIKIPQTRLTSTCTLMLTSVGIRWTIGRLLPTVSYLTSLDKYSLASLFIIAVELFYHGIMGALYSKLPNKLAHLIDNGFFIFFCFIIFLKQLFFCLFIIRINIYRRKVTDGKVLQLNNED